MGELEPKNRHPISEDDVREANDGIEAKLGLRPLPEESGRVEKATADAYTLLLVEGRAFAVLEGPDTETILPTLRALMEHRPTEHNVTVDMGAVPYLRNGADVMSPGITDADASIQEGDVVWISDEEHGAPLGIGHALIDGASMVEAEKGKAIATWHYVGDELWSVQA